MNYCYLVFEYEPKHKYGCYIHEGGYNPRSKVFINYDSVKEYCKNYKYASFIRKVALR